MIEDLSCCRIMLFKAWSCLSLDLSFVQSVIFSSFDDSPVHIEIRTFTSTVYFMWFFLWSCSKFKCFLPETVDYVITDERRCWLSWDSPSFSLFVPPLYSTYLYASMQLMMMLGIDLLMNWISIPMRTTIIFSEQKCERDSHILHLCNYGSHVCQSMDVDYYE